MDLVIYGILAIIIAIFLYTIWWMHERNTNLSVWDTKRMLPGLFISLLAFGGFLFYKIMQEMLEQKLFHSYLIPAFLMVLTLCWAGFSLLLAWLHATSAKSANS